MDKLSKFFVRIKIQPGVGNVVDKILLVRDEHYFGVLRFKLIQKDVNSKIEYMELDHAGKTKYLCVNLKQKNLVKYKKILLIEFNKVKEIDCTVYEYY